MYPTGGNPYGSVFGRDGRYAYNTNLLGTLPPEGHGPAARAADRHRHRHRPEDRQDRQHGRGRPDARACRAVARRPLSRGDGGQRLLRQPDIGRSSARSACCRSTASTARTLTLAAQAQTGQWGQGATWSRDGRTILLQGAVAREIEVYRFDGTSLKRDMDATLKFDTRPGAISTAQSR